jgi:sugar phosphate isomerase/epimerase
MYVPIPDRSGIDVSAVVDGLKRAGYDGWFTVHQTLQPGQTVREAMVEAYQTIAPLL